MKQKFLPLLLVLIIIMLVGCSSESDDGRIRIPSGANRYEGANYEEVVAELQGAGFTNVETEIVDDLITGWLTEDGEVEQVAVDGDTLFSSDDKFDKDVTIVVTYHTFPEETANMSGETEETEPVTNSSEIMDDVVITVENSDEFTAVLSSNDNIIFKNFADKYKGQKIEFDGCISYISNYDDYDTRYDLLLSASDYVDENTANSGPLFKFEDVNTFDMGIKDLYLPSFIDTGSNVHIVAEVLEYNSDADLFMLNPISVEER